MLALLVLHLKGGWMLVLHLKGGWLRRKRSAAPVAQM